MLERGRLRFVVPRNRLHDVAVPGKRRVHRQRPVGAENAIFRNLWFGEAAEKSRQTITGEPHRDRDSLRHLVKAPIPPMDGLGANFFRLVLKQISGRVETVDTDVFERSAAESQVDTNVAGLDLHRMNRSEKPRLTDFS